MEAIKKQASKFREQVAKQQQAVRRQFNERFGTDHGYADQADFQCHQKLRMLYNSTRAAKHFQRDIVRGVDHMISISFKQMEISKKLAEECCDYGDENDGSYIAKVSIHFGNAHKMMEKERETLLKMLGEQVFEPLQALIFSAPLEDARHLTYRYERVRRDVEAQAVDVVRRQVRCREARANAESMAKLQNAELRLSELKSTMSALGREATSAMESVDAQQQDTTFEKLLAMVEAEKVYHQNSASILNNLHIEMIEEKQKANLMAKTRTNNLDEHAQIEGMASKSHGSFSTLTSGHESVHFIAEVIHPFDAQAESELSLSVGDYVIVRKVSENGWSEGESKGSVGWFPSAYVLECEKTPAEKVEASP